MFSLTLILYSRLNTQCTPIAEQPSRKQIVTGSGVNHDTNGVYKATALRAPPLLRRRSADSTDQRLAQRAPQSERGTDQSAPILQEKTEKQTLGARRRQTWYPREPSL